MPKRSIDSGSGLDILYSQHNMLHKQTDNHHHNRYSLHHLHRLIDNHHHNRGNQLDIQSYKQQYKHHYNSLDIQRYNCYGRKSDIH